MPAEDPGRPLPGSRRYEGCFGCGRENPIGLGLAFRILDDLSVETEFVPDERHQGYPGLLHGGVLYSLLDETMGQAATARRTWVMTGRLEIRYLAPTPIRRRLWASARIVRQRSRAFEIAGEARLEDGTPVARASGLFMKIPDEMLRTIAGDADPLELRGFNDATPSPPAPPAPQ